MCLSLVKRNKNAGDSEMMIRHNRGTSTARLYCHLWWRMVAFLKTGILQFSHSLECGIYSRVVGIWRLWRCVYEIKGNLKGDVLLMIIHDDVSFSRTVIHFRESIFISFLFFFTSTVILLYSNDFSDNSSYHKCLQFPLTLFWSGLLYPLFWAGGGQICPPLEMSPITKSEKNPGQKS